MSHENKKTVMVDYNTILKIIDLHVKKCFSIAQIKSKLSKLSQDEKEGKLIGKLNDGEWEQYRHLLYMRKAHLDGMDHSRKLASSEKKIYFDKWGDIHEKYVPGLKFPYTPIESIEDITEWEKHPHTNALGGDATIGGYEDYTALMANEDKIFEYERRAFEKYDITANYDKVPDINLEDYADDKNGSLEQKQLQLQNNVTYSDNEINELMFYTSSGSRSINGRIYNNDFWNMGIKGLWAGDMRYVDNNFQKVKRNLDGAIDKSPSLQQDTKLYQGVYWDMKLNPGDTYTIKGYTSASFDKDEAKKFTLDQTWITKYPNRIDDAPANGNFLVTYLTPAGKKVLCMNDGHQLDGKLLTSMPQEKEALMGRNTKCTVISVDYEKKEAVVRVES